MLLHKTSAALGLQRKFYFVTGSCITIKLYLRRTLQGSDFMAIVNYPLLKMALMIMPDILGFSFNLLVQ